MRPIFCTFFTCKVSSLCSRIGCSEPTLLPFFLQEVDVVSRDLHSNRPSFHFTFQVQRSHSCVFLQILPPNVFTSLRPIFYQIQYFLSYRLLSYLNLKMWAYDSISHPHLVHKLRMSGDVPLLHHIPSSMCRDSIMISLFCS
jgi:hypothetical protein